jgi:hypothetical protein
VKTALRSYLCFFVLAVGFFAIAALLTEPAGDATTWEMHRTVILLAAAASAVLAWGAAVSLAAVHRVVWPLALAVGAICLAAALLLFRQPTV